ncbi:hypothetical protein [Arcticibacter sp. MXS-1]|uniref:hypothetical protein n=1 Tax=Arcticibacter sp. MXS-1 TaxID=3341726 RepID=UPI0035A89FB0
MASFSAKSQGEPQNNPTRPPSSIAVNDQINSTPTSNTLNYIGEIKGRSYIKLSLEPVEGQANENTVLTEIKTKTFKGSYYEAASGKNYSVTATYEMSSQSWNIKSYNSRKQYVANFQGRETAEGVIEGAWKNKHENASFYLFKKEKP